MSSIPGPIIRFTIDAPGLSAAVTPAMNDVKNQARAASEAVAESWRVTAAKIRAELSVGVTSQQAMNSEREKLLGTLTREISALQQRNELSDRELASLKAMTLERERQVDAIKRGVGVGVTSGTSSALGQVSTQTMLGVERILDSLVNRYLGGAAGALTRTVRDVSYYSNQATGGTGGGLFGLSGSTLGVVGGAAALAAVATGLTAVAVKGGSLAVELTKLSEKTGLTVDEVIKLRSASSALDADFDRITIGFKKFSSELTLASTADLPNASKSAKEAAALFKALGVDVKLAAQDPFAAIQQLSRTLATLPDGFVKTNASTVLFGRGGMELIPVFDRLNPALVATGKSSKDLAAALTGGTGVIQSAEALRAQTVNYRNEVDALEVALSRKLLPTIVSVVEWINDHTSQIKGTIVGAANALTGGTEGVLANLLSYFSGSKSGSAVDFSKFVEFLSTGNTSKKLNDIADALAKVGDGSEEAAKHARAAAKEFEDWQKMLTSSPEFKRSAGYIQNRHDEEVNKILGLNGPPNIGLPAFSFPNLPLIGNQPAPGDILDQIKKVNDECLKETQSETDKVKAQYDAQLDYWKFIQNQYPDVAKQAADAITKIQEIENQKLADLQTKAFEKYKKDADKLFDDLLSGKTKSFTKTLEKDIEDIITQPARKMFDDLIGKMLQGLDQAVNGKTGSGAGAANSSGGGVLGGILGKFGIGPGGTAGTFAGSLGLGKSGTGSVAIQSGQTGVMTQTMNVQANIVNIGAGSGSGVPGAASFTGGGLPQFGTFFGNLNPFGGGSSFFGNNNPLGGSTSASGIGGNVAGILGGLLVGGMGVAHGSVTSEAMGAAAVAGSIAKIFAPGQLGGKLAGGFAGAGLLASGLSQPGFSGMLSDVAGGAEIGTAIMPGIGTAIGAAAGAIAGLIKGIFGGKSWAQRVQSAMNKQAVFLPPSETFDFASNGSIANTLQTGFSQSGNTVSTFQLPANTPFFANPIYGPLSKYQRQLLAGEEGGFIPGQPFGGFPPVNPFIGQGPVGSRHGSPMPHVQVNLNLPGVIDAGSIGTSLGPHMENLARMISRQVYSSSSGFARSIRSAVALA